jgi:hypothetical protein
MKLHIGQITLLAFLALNTYGVTVSANTPTGTGTCHYEIYTPNNFNKPIVTEEFQIVLERAEFRSTEHPGLKRAIRLQTQPATIDGKKHTHFAFSLTYDGAHAGAIVPAQSGRHVMMISRDDSDIVGGYLFCDLKMNSNVYDSDILTSRPPEYETIRCVNTDHDHKYSEVRFRHIKGKKYRSELWKNVPPGEISVESLGEVELYLFNKDEITLAGTEVVTNFAFPDGSGRAVNARVQLSKPFYESKKWLCKSKTALF